MITNLLAEQRELTGKIALKQLRKESRLPGIIFGANADNMMIHLSKKEFERFARSGNSGVVHIDVAGVGAIPALLEDVQRDPISSEFIHVDFLRVDNDAVVRTKVSIEYSGTASGTKTGGILQTQSTWIEVEALPDRIPSAIVADISHLEVGDSLFVGDLLIPEGVSLISAADELLISVVAPKVG